MPFSEGAQAFLPDKKKKRRRVGGNDKPRYGNLQKQARRDVRLSQQPYFRELERQEQAQRDLYEESTSATQDIYGRVANELGDLIPNYRRATENIGTGLVSQMGTLAGNLGISLPQTGEGTAAQMAMGAIGGSGLNLLANNEQRNVNYAQSAKRQGVIDEATTERNFLEDMQDAVREISQMRIDARYDAGPQILARLDELKSRKKEERLATQELELRERIADDQLGFQKKQYRDTKKSSNRAQNFAEEQILSAQEKEKLKPVNKDIQALKDELDRLQKKYKSVSGSGGADALAAQELKKKIDRKQAQLRKRRKRKRKIKR